MRGRDARFTAVRLAGLMPLAPKSLARLKPRAPKRVASRRVSTRQAESLRHVMLEEAGIPFFVMGQNVLIAG
jgi:hypothetical protein